MSKLLRADFVRLFKSRIFLLGVLFMAGLAGLIVYTTWNDMQEITGYYRSADDVLFVGGVYVGIVIAIVTGIFIGTDYSDGTIRNKHIIGHSRMAMYLSNLIVCSTASVIMHLAFIAVIAGSSAMGIIGRSKGETITLLIVISVFSVLAISAILLLITMLISKKSAGVVTAMVFSLFMMFAASTIDYRLSAKEYIEPYHFTVMTEDGTEKEIKQPSMKNPKYLKGTKRKVFQFFHNTLPVDQIMQICQTETCNVNFVLSSLAVILITTGAGILIFCKKDLK